MDNPAILRAISAAITGTDYKQIGNSGNGVFTSKATLAVWNYDNLLSAPPYPPYLPETSVDADGNPLPAASTFNAPLVPEVDLVTPAVTDVLIDVELAGTTTGSQWTWPNLHTIDWVDYDGTSSRTETLDPSLWPKARVFVLDATNPNVIYQCVDVSPFFSFEEAYCYFCWDTVDRVTDGSFATGSAGEICIGSSCGTSGNGTTRYYMTIKFNNQNALNFWLNAYAPGTVAAVEDIIAPWLPLNNLVPPTYTFPVSITDPVSGNTITSRPMAVEAELQFAVSGVFVYPWKFKSVNGITGAFGTMTMAQATGFASNPWCGVLGGSVKIVEKTGDVCVTGLWPIP